MARVLRQLGGRPARFALYWEDESGATAAYSFWDIQQAANRLSNAPAALGVNRGDRVAIILPQRPETAIAYVAVFQMGAIALPLSHLFGPDALEYRMEHAEASVAIVEPTTIGNLRAIRDRLTHLRACDRMDLHEGGIKVERSAPKGERALHAEDTKADDPALIIYTSGTTGPPKGALKAHRVLLGNAPGFVHSHDFFPQPGDMFWSPADWAWTGGLMDALLPAWLFGMPILGYRGRFDAEKAYYLLEKYGVRNSFLFPTALKLMMKAFPSPKAKFDISLRSIMSAGESVGVTVFEWAKAELGVTINEMFGQTEINYVVGNCQSAWPAKPGSIGRPYPGHRVAVIDDKGNEARRGELGEIAVNRRFNGQPTRCSSSSTGRTRTRRAKSSSATGAAPAIRRRWTRTVPLVPGPFRRRDQERGLPHRAGGDRKLPGEAPGGAERRGDRQARRHARLHRKGFHRLAAGKLPSEPSLNKSRNTSAVALHPTNTRARSSSSKRCR